MLESAVAGRGVCVVQAVRVCLSVPCRRMRDDLQQLRDKTIELELKMDRVRLLLGHERGATGCQNHNRSVFLHPCHC